MGMSAKLSIASRSSSTNKVQCGSLVAIAQAAPEDDGRARGMRPRLLQGCRTPTCGYVRLPGRQQHT